MKRLVHKLIGHIPYWVYTEVDEQKRETKVYRCTLCSKELVASMYNRLEVR